MGFRYGMPVYAQVSRRFVRLALSSLAHEFGTAISKLQQSVESEHVHQEQLVHV